MGTTEKVEGMFRELQSEKEKERKSRSEKGTHCGTYE